MANQILGLIFIIVMLVISFIVANSREPEIKRLAEENKTLKEILLDRDKTIKLLNRRTND